MRDGLLDRIVEYKDANEDERRVRLCNAGIYARRTRNISSAGRRKLGNDNAQKEYYLTDVPPIAKAEGVRCARCRVRRRD